MEGLNATYGAQDIPAYSRKSLIGGSQGSKIASAQRSGLIWVQNPCRYVAMSRKVPPQAVTSRRRGGIEGLGIWLRISRAESPEGGYRKAGVQGRSNVVDTFGQCMQIKPGARRKTAPNRRRALFQAFAECRAGICADHVSNTLDANIVRIPGRVLKRLKIRP